MDGIVRLSEGLPRFSLVLPNPNLVFKLLMLVLKHFSELFMVGLKFNLLAFITLGMTSKFSIERFFTPAARLMPSASRRIRILAVGGSPVENTFA